MDINPFWLQVPAGVSAKAFDMQGGKQKSLAQNVRSRDLLLNVEYNLGLNLANTGTPRRMSAQSG